MPPLGCVSLSRKHLVSLPQKFQNARAAHVACDKWLKEVAPCPKHKSRNMRKRGRRGNMKVKTNPSDWRDDEFFELEGYI